jgi:hydroxymethylbilane synthase
MKSVIRLGSRTSKMAVAQVDYVERLLKAALPELTIERCTLTCDGDTVKGSLKEWGGKGAFTSTLDQAMIEGEIDISVNCMKDIPNDHERGLKVQIGAVLPRENVEDVLLFRKGESLESFAQGRPRVGSSSPRRVAQLARQFPSWDIVPFRGNADTRISKLDRGEIDIVILARAGLERLGVAERISMVLPVDQFPPAFGQGILTLDCRRGDQNALAVIERINHLSTWHIMQAERAFLNLVQGSCHTAIAGEARIDGEFLSMRVFAYNADGSHVLSATEERYPIDAGSHVAELLIKKLEADGLRTLWA